MNIRTLTRDLDEILAKRVTNHDLPCAVAGVANTAGTLYTGAAGVRSLDGSDAMTPDTLVAIASMTKAITTVATLQLVEQGHIDLDAPVTRYLPELEPLKVLQGFDNQGHPNLNAPDTIPTTRQLLTHTSGYVYEMWNANGLRHVANGGIDSLFTEGGNALSAPLAFSPGERWEYGIGIDWAGRIVETLSGLGLDEYFQAHIFSPLGMQDTFYQIPPEKAARRAAIHARLGDALAVTPHLGDSVSGGGGLTSTVVDYLRFMRMLLNQGTLEGAVILQPATVDLMFKNHIGDLEVLPGTSQMPAVSNDFDMGFGAPAQWGLGFLIHQGATQSGRPRGSVSWAGLFNSYFWIDREHDLCAVIGTQVLPFYDTHAVTMLKDFESALYASLRD